MLLFFSPWLGNCFYSFITYEAPAYLDSGATVSALCLCRRQIDVLGEKATSWITPGDFKGRHFCIISALLVFTSHTCEQLLLFWTLFSENPPQIFPGWTSMYVRFLSPPGQGITPQPNVFFPPFCDSPHFTSCSYISHTDRINRR